MAKSKSKKNVFKTITEFIEGVKSETKKIMWPSKKNLIKYSVVTIAFIVFFCVFFIGAEALAKPLVALVKFVKELIG